MFASLLRILKTYMVLTQYWVLSLSHHIIWYIIYIMSEILLYLSSLHTTTKLSPPTQLYYGFDLTSTRHRQCPETLFLENGSQSRKIFQCHPRVAIWISNTPFFGNATVAHDQKKKTLDGTSWACSLHSSVISVCLQFCLYLCTAPHKGLAYVLHQFNSLSHLDADIFWNDTCMYAKYQKHCCLNVA